MFRWSRKQRREQERREAGAMVHTSTFVATAEVWDFLITRLGYKGEDVKKAALVYGEAHKDNMGTTTQLAILKNMEKILREQGAQPRA